MILFLIALITLVPSTFQQITIQVPEPSSSHACNGSSCNSGCISNGYQGGFQYAGVCFCIQNNKTNNVVPAPDWQRKVVKLAVPSDLLSCDQTSCDADCRSNGYQGGFCLAGICFCKLTTDHYTISSTTNPSIVIKLPVLSNILDCNGTTCDSECRSLGYPNGFCLNGECFCRVKRNYDAPTTVASLKKGVKAVKSSVGNCDPSWCTPLCNGHCSNGICYCP